jgi:predicted RNase H-like HicB family nuclease
MAQQFNVVIEQDEDGFFVASVPSLPGCHTQAKSLDVLMERVREAIELYIEVEGLPTSALGFVGIQQVTIAA